MGFISEFKQFAFKGNMLDLAVGVVIGSAFGKVISSLVEKVISPALGLLTGGVDFSKKGIEISKIEKFGEDGKTVVETIPNILGYGAFVQSLIDFLIVAAALFLVVKMINTAKKRFEKEQAAAPPAAAPEDILLLREIRDSLAKNTPRRVTPE